MTFVKAIVSGDHSKALRMIEASPALVTRAATIGASRKEAAEYFFLEIRHYIYSGDTALHMAAAAFRSELCRQLIHHGANVSARNRRGAEPLHYASDANTWNPDAQAATIECLIRCGANPNSLDKSGVAPIHRAVRTRSAAAVRALIHGGASPNLPNKNGSTALHLAVQNTGRGGSGSPEAIQQQREIIVLLLQSGASIKEKDGSGKTVEQIVKSGWIRELLG
jgi:ankyrin repeat protein